MADDERGQDLLASIAMPWQAALQEGWAAFCAGNPPVGAVITGPDGAIVAAGRNRSCGRSRKPRRHRCDLGFGHGLAAAACRA